jgi:hypothetical protein
MRRQTCQGLGFRPRDIAVSRHFPSPGTAAAPAVDPDVWDMPSHGIEWCDCGQHHVLDRDTVLHMANGVVQDPEWLTHEEVIETAMDLWNYIAVCKFFLMAIRASAIAVSGRQSPKYPFERGLEIVAHFSKTWQGCPEEICTSVRDREN